MKNQKCGINFLKLWWEEKSDEDLLTKEISDLAANNNSLSNLLGNKNGRSRVISLGKALSNLEGRTFGAYKILKGAGDPRSGGNSYFLKEV